MRLVCLISPLSPFLRYTINMKFDTPQDRASAVKAMQSSLNQQWEEEFYPLVYSLFQKDNKPQIGGKYVEIRSRGGLPNTYELNELKHQGFEIACYPSVKCPAEPKALDALFNGRGQQRAFDSLKQQVLCECCKTLNSAGYRPDDTKSTEDYFENFIKKATDKYRGQISSNLEMSKIKIMAADDTGCLSDDPEKFRQPRIGFVVCLTMNLCIKVSPSEITRVQ